MFAISCPECDEFMNLRRSYGGAFLRCPNYPSCDDIKIRREYRDLDDEELQDLDEEMLDY